MRPNIKLTRAMERSRGTRSAVHSYVKPNRKCNERSRYTESVLGSNWVKIRVRYDLYSTV
jgi:hypothetical protein